MFIYDLDPVTPGSPKASVQNVLKTMEDKIEDEFAVATETNENVATETKNNTDKLIQKEIMETGSVSFS